MCILGIDPGLRSTGLATSSGGGKRGLSPSILLSLRWLLVVVFMFGLGLSGCTLAPQRAQEPKLVMHSFSCDMWFDNWAEQAALLAYSYGDQVPMLSKKAPYLGREALGCGGVTMPMPVAEFLYVKWRLKATGEILEDRVDLRGRLPADMTDHTITYLIDGRQLYVFVLLPDNIKKSSNDGKRTHKTWLSKFNVTQQIYPLITH